MSPMAVMATDSDHADWLKARLVIVLEHLYPSDRRSPEAWNRLSEDQARRGYRVEEVAPGVWWIRLGQPEKLVPTRFQEHDKVWGGLVPDFATPEGRRTFAAYHAGMLVDKGVKRLQARRVRPSTAQRHFLAHFRNSRFFRPVLTASRCIS